MTGRRTGGQVHLVFLFLKDRRDRLRQSVHLIGDPSARVVYVIEGLLKADISHCLTGRTFAAIAGANNTSPLDPLFALLRRTARRNH